MYFELGVLSVLSHLHFFQDSFGLSTVITCVSLISLYDVVWGVQLEDCLFLNIPQDVCFCFTLQLWVPIQAFSILMHDMTVDYHAFVCVYFTSTNWQNIWYSNALYICGHQSGHITFRSNITAQLCQWYSPSVCQYHSVCIHLASEWLLTFSFPCRWRTC